jgi:hypothetical protein
MRIGAETVHHRLEPFRRICSTSAFEYNISRWVNDKQPPAEVVIYIEGEAGENSKM